MKRFFSLLAFFSVFAILAGCAHPINMRPDIGIISSLGAPKIDKAVGYHISDTNLSAEITTPGGGGDKVRYFPYRDMEAGFYKALAEVFTKVTKISNPKDLEGLKKAGITLMITPEIMTTSSSPSLLTWPPTEFTVTLNCKVVGTDGLAITEVKAVGVGKAEFSEFKGNFSLSAVRASEEAVKNLMKALSDDPNLRR